MPTNYRVKVAGTGAGSYTEPLSVHLEAQSSSGSATYNKLVLFVPPYVGGLVPGYATGSKPFQATSEYGNIRAAYLCPVSAITGVGASGAGATATIQLYRAGSAQGAALSLAFNSGTDATALTGTSLGSVTSTYQTVRFGDSLVFRWAQGGTGLALPEAVIVIDIV